MASRSLRAVAEGEKAPVKRAARRKAPAAGTVQKAVVSNSRRAELVAIRRRIAMAIDDPNTHPRDLAELTRRLMDIGAAIDTIDIAAGKRRTVRQPKTAVAPTNDETWNSEAI